MSFDVYRARSDILSDDYLNVPKNRTTRLSSKTELK